MDAQRAFERHGLAVIFGASVYHFRASSPRFPWTEVTAVDEANYPFLTFDGTPFASKYEGAHCIYRGYMEQFEYRGGKRIVGFREVALKWVVGSERLAGARREARLYGNELRGLHGSVVPKFYGFFEGIIGEVEVGCLVLEWCKGEPITDPCEVNRQRMLSGIALHMAGVQHGNILDTTHFLSAGDGTLRVVGFSSAIAHRCCGATVLSKDSTGDPRPQKNCRELAALESRFGVDAELRGRYVRWANRIFPEFDPGFFMKY